MIIDEIIASIWRQGDSTFAEKWARATVIQVPFSLGGANGDGADRLLALVPPGDTELLSCNAPWARPPYPLTILVSDNEEEHSALFVEQFPVEEGEALKWKAKAVLFTFAIESRITAPVAFDTFEQRGDGVTYCTTGDPDLMTEEQKKELNRELVGLFTLTAPMLLESGHPIIKAHIAERMSSTKTFRGVLLYEVVTAFALLACKNIEQRDILPSRQVRRAAVREGRPAPFTVKTLVVKPMAKRGKGAATEGNGSPLALHWVRGHFKSFTQDRPLFGRVTGTFWWTPHLAGDREVGVVVKDYKIEREDPLAVDWPTRGPRTDGDMGGEG